MKLIKTFITFLLWDVTFTIMVSIMIIAINYANDKMTQTMDMQYTYMYIGLHTLFWLFVGGFIITLFHLKKGATSKNAKLIEFLVVCIPAIFFITLYFNHMSITAVPFLLNNTELLRSLGALILGCEVFGFFVKNRRG